MKTILAFGDSLTHGMIAVTQERHPYEDRWPSVLEVELGGEARIIAEALNGRTTVFDDPVVAADRNGARVLPTLLDSHAQLDLVIIMLGTNDIKLHVGGSAFAAAMGIKRCAEIVLTSDCGPGWKAPKVLLVAPPRIVRPANPSLMMAPRPDESHLFAPFYQAVATEVGCGFFDAATVAKSVPEDGIHLDAENTRAIGTALAPVVKDLLGL